MIKIISDTAWYVYLLCLIIGLIFATALYFRNKKTSEISPFISKILFAIRLLGVFILCILLTDLFLKRVINKTEKPIIIIAIDNSSSVISNKDSSLIKELVTKKIPEITKELSQSFLINTYTFGSKTKKESAVTFKDKETSFSNLFDEITNNYAGLNVGALIVLSDGIYNKGTNPTFITEKLNYPIYTIAVGDTLEKKDAWIHKINHNQIAYLGNQFLVEVNLSAVKLIEKELVVSLYKNDIKKGEQKIKINSNNFNSTMSFICEADAPGIQKYQIKINAVPEEFNLSNNLQSFIIDVIDNRDKLLITANAPHPDISAISESIETLKSYELIKEISDNPSKLLKPYSLVIIHGFKNIHQKLLDDCIAQQIPYFIINPSLTNNLGYLKVVSNLNKLNDAEPTLNPTFNLFTISEELKTAIHNFPAINTPFGNYTTSNGSQFLIQQQIGSVKTNDPILLFNETNGLKSAIFIGDGLWRWRLRNFQETKNFNAFNELINKTIQYLSVKSDKSFFRVFTQKIINETELVEFSAEVYNKSYEAITEPDVNLTLKNSEGKSFQYVFSKQTKSYKLVVGYLAAGEYSYEATVKLDSKLQIKKGILIIKPVISEQINTTANHNLLYQISKNSGGKLVHANQMPELVNQITKNETIKPITYSQNSTSELIDLKWIFAVLLFLFGIEWFLRKYNGLI